jgi:uncharacterized protein (TIGR02145 family)
MKKFLPMFITVFVLLVSTASALAQTTRYVPQSAGSPGYATVQEAINASVTGDLIELSAGTYTEMITIDKSIHLKSEAGAIIKAPSTMPVATDPLSNIITVTGSGVSAEISGLAIQGTGPSGCGSIGRGIFVKDGAYANIHNNQISRIRDNPFSGCQNGVAIQVGRNAWNTSGTATIASNIISGYQKAGIVVDNTGSSATITDNTITGAGTTAVIAQNGIQVSRGATATFAGNAISGNSFHQEGNDYDWGSCGILLYQSGAVSLTGGNNLSGNDNNYYASDVTGALTLGAEIFGSSTAPVTKGYQIALDANYNLDATSCTFGGINPATASIPQHFNLEDRIWHRADDQLKTGFVRVKAGNVIVTHSETGAHIQFGIDVASAGDVVHVLAGDYGIETAADRMIFGVNGPHQFGLFIDKDNLTLKGYKAGGIPVASASEAAVVFNTGSTANFGPSGIFVQANGVKIEGLKIGDNMVDGVVNSNKTIEVIGDAFSMTKCFINTSADQGAFYMGVWDPAHPIVSYSITNNLFNNSLVSINNGAGTSGPNSGRIITGNQFTGAATPYLIGFRGWNGAGPVQGWINYPVGGAVITGNAFNNTTLENYIVARGNAGGYDNSQLNWAEIWNNNTYGNRVVTLSDEASFEVRTYNNGGYPESRRISNLIQPNLVISQTGDAVKVGAGTYDEDVSIDKSVKLLGADKNTTIIRGLKTGASQTLFLGANTINVSGFTITRDGNNVSDWATNAKTSGIAFGQSLTGCIVENCIVTGNRNGVYLNNTQGHIIRNNTITNNRTGVQLVNNVSDCLFEHNTISENWTMGFVVYYASDPMPQSTNVKVNNNSISGNWFSQVECKTVSANPTVSYDFSKNWFGTNPPTVLSTLAGEPGYALQIPVLYGGTATSPGGNEGMISGDLVAKINYIPWYTDATMTKLFYPTVAISASACNRFTSPSGKYVWTTSGIYDDIILNHAGGDSLLIVDLTITDCCPADIDESGIVDIEDFLFFNGQFGTSCNACESDIDGNSQVNIDDFLLFIPKFNTPADIMDIDGNKYKTVIIDNKIWMTENLKTSRFNNLTLIPLVTDNTVWNNTTTSAYCWYNNDQAAYANPYGALYNYPVVSNDNVCPADWHVPGDTEWTALTDFLGGSEIAGGKLKETGTSHWISPNAGATNETGFTALPGGYRSGGNFYNLGSYGNWWSSTENTGTGQSWARIIENGFMDVTRSTDNMSKGISIRCVRDK